MRKFIIVLLLLVSCQTSHAKRLDEMNSNTSPDITNDFIYSQDVSDTSEASQGTGKKLTIKNLLKAGNITVDGVNVGINTTTPQQKLQVVGTVQATAFIGDGSGLTGVAASASDAAYSLSWNGDTTGIASKNALYDKIETISSGSSGWTQNGVSLYNTTTTDNVGIGTVSANKKLSVSGSIAINGSTSSNSLVLGGKWNHFYGLAGLDYDWMQPVMANSPMRLGLIGNGSIGGTSDTLIAGIKIFQTTDATDLTNSCDVGMYMTSSGFRINTKHNGTCPSFPLQFGHQDTIIDMTLTNDGNLGIGTINPTTKLQVSGTVTATAFVGDGSGLTNISGGSVGIGTANTITFWPTTTTIGSLPTATYPSLTELSYVKDVTSAIQTQLNAKDAVTTAGDFITRTANDFDVDALDEDNMASNSAVHLATQQSIKAYVDTAISGVSGGAGGWTDGGTNVYLTATTDNVAIGTTTPNAQLLVENIGTQESFRVNDSATDTTPFVITSVGNVGIGTIFPIHSLAIRLATSSGLTITNTATSGSTAGSGIQAVSDDNSAVVQGDRLGFYAFSGSADTADTIQAGASISGFADGTWTASSAPAEIKFETAPSGSVTRAVNMIVKSTGNVGVGTQQPQSLLQVAGDTRVGNGTFTNTSANEDLYVEGNLEVDGTLYGDGSGLTGISAGGWVDGGTNIYASPTTDNVAIGTTTPTQKLTVVGTISATAFVGDGSGLTNLGASAWTDGGTNVYTTTTTDAVAIGTTTPVSGSILTVNGILAGSGSGPMAITNANVGIGTTTASSLLAVGTTGQASITSSGVATLPTPNLTSKIDINNVAVNDDDCSGEQGLFWYDSTDSAFEFCKNNSGTPERLGQPSPPASQTIAAGDTITANACGTFKDISSAGAVTTSTTNTFTAPSADLSGCCMNVVNTGANNITLDNNALFYSVGAADVVLGLADSAIVCTNGTVWAQMGGSNN